MSILTSVGIIVLAMLIQALLQLTPSVFSIWYHYALGKNSKNKVLDLSGYFVVGVESMVLLLAMIIYFVMLKVPNTDLTNLILAGILVAMGMFGFFGYYRKGRSTELFISRKTARGFCAKAKTAHKKSDIFVLGIVTCVSELFLTLPLLIVVIMQAINFAITDQMIIFAVYLLVVMTPTGVVRGNFLNGKNLADIQKTRVKNKNFYRIMIGCSYVVMAFLLVMGIF